MLVFIIVLIIQLICMSKENNLKKNKILYSIKKNDVIYGLFVHCIMILYLIRILWIFESVKFPAKTRKSAAWVII